MLSFLSILYISSTTRSISRTLFTLKVVRKSEVEFSKNLTFFSNMFYLKVGSVANKKMVKKVYVAVPNFAAAPQKEG